MLETARLVLRLPAESDARPLMAIHLDPEVVARGQVILTSASGGIDDARRNVERMLRHWHSWNCGQWAVVEKATDEVVACVGFFHRGDEAALELGWIVRRSRWGCGIATEAARAAVEWAWTASGIDHIVSLITPGNTASERVAAKIGERYERETIEPLAGVLMNVYGIRRPGLVLNA